MIFATVKAYTAQAVEATAPTAVQTNFASIIGRPRNGNISRLVEFRLASPSVSGSPTAVLFDIYRFNPGTVTVDYLTTYTVNATDITAGKVAPIIAETWGNELMVKVSFTGGTAPTFTGTVQARVLE